MLKIDSLIEKIIKTRNPVCIGLDTMYDYVPVNFADRRENFQNPLAYAADVIFKFNKEIVDAIYDIIPCVKVQVAYYEMYGVYGMQVFYDTICYAKSKNLIVIADVKRNDIGSTAKCYANAYLDGVDVDSEHAIGFDSDFITVNPYLGSDGIMPFIESCKETGKGIFALVKTSNASSGEFQDLQFSNKTLYEIVGEHVINWGKDLIGKYNYSSVGAVVGATYPEQAKKLRENLESVFFLVPGYGAQGAGAKDIAVNFDEKGLGAIVNSSRAILLAYKQQKYSSLDFAQAARQAVLDMQSDILENINL